MSEYLATAAADVKLWSVPASSERKYTAACSFTPHHITDVADVAWAHDGSQIAVAAKDSVTVHDLKGNIVETVPSGADFLRTDEIKSVGFLQKSRYLTFCGTDKLIRVWDRTESKFTKTFSGHTSAIQCLAVNCEEILIASGSASGDILVHNRLKESQSTLETPVQKGITAMEYSYFKRTILSAAAEDGSVHFWDTNRSASPTQSFHNAHLDSATSLAFSPYNKFLMSTCGHDRKIVLYDVERSGIVKTIATESPLSSIAFKSDGVTLAVGTTQGKLYIYDLRHGMKPVESIWAHEPYAIRAVAFQLPEMRRTIKPSTKSAKKVVPKVEEIGSSKPTLNLSTTSTAPTSIASKLHNNAETVAPETPKNRLLKTEKANYMDMFSPVHTVDIGKLSVTGVEHSLAKPSNKNTILSENPTMSHHRKDFVSAKMPMEIFSPIGKTISDKKAVESSSLATSPTILRGSLNSSQGGSDHLTPPLSNLADTKVRFTPSADGLEFESKFLKSSSSHSLSSQPSRSKSHSDISSAINQQSSKLNSSETPSSTTGRSAEREQNENMSRPEQATLHSQAVNAKHQVRADENVPPNQTLNTTTFQLQLLENVVDDCLSGFRASVRNDVQNMHLELLRQFQIQKAELEAMFRKYTNIDALVDEVERLREENKRLKMNF